MPDDRESLMPEGVHSSFRGLAMVGLVGRLRGLAVASQVRADDGEVPSEQGRDTVPGGVCPRVAVEEQDRRPAASVAHANDHIAEVDSGKLEVTEHWPSIRLT